MPVRLVRTRLYPPPVVPYIAVVGPSAGKPSEHALGEQVGRLIARSGAILVCGGLGGVMEAAAAGCAAEGGTSIGILPTELRSDANPHVTVAVATGMGEARNAIVVRTADAVIAVGGEFGTLSEIALALKMGKPVIGIGTWSLSREGLDGDPLVRADTPEEAVAIAIAAAS
jgi:uncharacterized protein (TIGR00725 family)